MARETTRNLLLDIGKRTFLERGYASSGIETILQAACVPKGSFYYYFHSKEDFGLQVLDRFARSYDEMLEQAFGDVSLHPIDRFRRYFEVIADRFDEDPCRKGCLVGNLSQELANHSEAFRIKLEEIFQGWGRRYEECLKLAHEAGEIDPVLSLSDCVELWLSGWQGALLRAKTTRSSAPLRKFLAIMFAHVFRAAALDPCCALPEHQRPHPGRHPQSTA